MPTVEVLGDVYEFRRITRKEIRDMDASSADMTAFEDSVCVTCVTSTPPGFPGWDDCLAGIPSVLCQQILEESGFQDDSTVLQYRALDWAATPEGRLDGLICFCFPSVSLEDMDNMDPELYCKYAAMARVIVHVIYKMDASEFLNPETGLPPSVELQKNSRPISYAPGL